MNQVYSTIKIRKYKHLNLQERSQIQILLKQGNSITKISKMLRRSRTTIYNELKRGTVPQIKQNKKKVLIYYPDTGQKVYEMNRKNSKKKFKIGQCPDFVMYVNRCYKTFKIQAKDNDSVCQAITKLFKKLGDKADEVFKSITFDNGLEFADMTIFEKQSYIYYTHPYSSYGRGSNERHNGLLRRFIPKGKSISDYDSEEIMYF